MGDDRHRDEDSRLALKLQQHQKTLGELSDTLTAHLLLHAARDQAFYAAAKEIVANNPVPAAIAEKVNRGGALGDMESFDAETRAYRAREMVGWITEALTDAENNPNSEQVINDFRHLDGFAQLERDRGCAALEQLKARIDYLEKWVLNLSADAQAHAYGPSLRH